MLLSLLRHHLRALTAQLAEPISASTASPPPPPQSTHPAAPPSAAAHLEPSTTTITPNPTSSKTDARLARLARLKPPVLFLTLVGDLASRVADANEGRVTESERYPRDVFRVCLARVGGVADAAGVEGLTARGDLEMVRLLGVGMVFGGGAEVQMKEGEGGDEEGLGGWDVRGLVRGIVLGDDDDDGEAGRMES